MVRLYLSTLPLVCGWYAMVRTVSVPRTFITAMKKFDTNWGPWSDRIRSGGPQQATQASIMADATEIAIMRRRVTHLVNFEKRSVMTRMKRLPALVAGIGPKISTDRSVNGSVAGKRVNGDVCRRSDSRVWAQVVHFVIVLYISVTMDGQ